MEGRSKLADCDPAGRPRTPRAPAATLVYSCSGSSNVAQLANYVAVRLDRMGLAEMSCIVGVGGDVRPLVKKATAGAPIVAIDGCPLVCCARVLAAKGVEPKLTVRLHELGLRKRQHADFSEDEREAVYRQLLDRLAPLLLEERPDLAAAIRAELRTAG